MIGSKSCRSLIESAHKICVRLVVVVVVLACIPLCWYTSTHETERTRIMYVAIMLSRCKVAFADVCQMVMLMDDRLTLDLTAALLQFVPQQEEVLATSI
mgnify:CR=1 FL=1